jgi:hypothetical protein
MALVASRKGEECPEGSSEKLITAYVYGWWLYACMVRLWDWKAGNDPKSELG